MILINKETETYYNFCPIARIMFTEFQLMYHHIHGRFGTCIYSGYQATQVPIYILPSEEIHLY